MLKVAADIRAAAIEEAEADVLFEEWLATRRRGRRRLRHPEGRGRGGRRQRRRARSCSPSGPTRGLAVPGRLGRRRLLAVGGGDQGGVRGDRHRGRAGVARSRCSTACASASRACRCTRSCSTAGCSAASSRPPARDAPGRLLLPRRAALAARRRRTAGSTSRSRRSTARRAPSTSTRPAPRPGAAATERRRAGARLWPQPRRRRARLIVKSGPQLHTELGEGSGPARLPVDDAQRVLDDRTSLAEVAAGDHDLAARGDDVLDDGQACAIDVDALGQLARAVRLGLLADEAGRDARSPATAPSRAGHRRARGRRARRCRRGTSGASASAMARSSDGIALEAVLVEVLVAHAPDRSVNVPVR